MLNWLIERLTPIFQNMGGKPDGCTAVCTYMCRLYLWNFGYSSGSYFAYGCSTLDCKKKVHAM